jgi:hypothetical protein
LGKDHTHCATLVEFEIGANNSDDKIKLPIKREYFYGYTDCVINSGQP